MVSLLYRFAGSPEPDSAHPFTDVGENEALSWAYGKGVVNGRSKNRFAPDDPVTRQEIAVILTRYLDICGSLPQTGSDNGKTGFQDEDEIAPWAVEAVAGMRDLGILAGDEQGRFRPVSNCTRAEMAVILCRTADLPAGNGG